MAPRSSTAAWKIPWREEPGGLQSMGSLRARLHFHFHFSLSCIGEGNGDPLQYSCLENPRDRGAQWAAVYGVAQNWTRLKRLSSSSSSIHNIAFSGGSDSIESACIGEDLGSVPGSGRSPGEGNGNPLQYSCLENPMDRGVWWVTVHGVAKSRDMTEQLKLTQIDQGLVPQSSTKELVSMPN